MLHYGYVGTFLWCPPEVVRGLGPEISEVPVSTCTDNMARRGYRGGGARLLNVSWSRARHGAAYGLARSHGSPWST